MEQGRYEVRKATSDVGIAELIKAVETVRCVAIGLTLCFSVLVSCGSEIWEGRWGGNVDHYM